MNNSWLRQIMSLKISNLEYKDITKLLIIYYCLQYNCFNKIEKIKKLNIFVYRFYIDNRKLALINPSIVIKNISKYGPEDIMFITRQAFSELKVDIINNSIEFDDNSFSIYIDDYSEEIKLVTKKIVDMLFEKSTGISYNYSPELLELNNISSYDLDFLNSTRLRNRVQENMQYCACCDSNQDLHLINISNNIEFLFDNKNYLLLCDEHYGLYKNDFFSFNKTGFINIKKANELLDYRMHISNKVMRDARKYFE